MSGEVGWQDLVGAGGVPVVVVLVEVLVKPFVSDERYYPVAAIVLGVVLNLLAAAAMGWAWQRAALYCVLTGAAAAGYYKAGKSALEGEA